MYGLMKPVLEFGRLENWADLNRCPSDMEPVNYEHVKGILVDRREGDNWLKGRRIRAEIP